MILDKIYEANIFIFIEFLEKENKPTDRMVPSWGSVSPVWKILGLPLNIVKFVYFLNNWNTLHQLFIDCFWWQYAYEKQRSRVLQNIYEPLILSPVDVWQHLFVDISYQNQQKDQRNALSVVFTVIFLSVTQMVNR